MSSPCNRIHHHHLDVIKLIFLSWNRFSAMYAEASKNASTNVPLFAFDCAKRTTAICILSGLSLLLNSVCVEKLIYCIPKIYSIISQRYE